MSCQCLSGSIFVCIRQARQCWCCSLGFIVDKNAPSMQILLRQWPYASARAQSQHPNKAHSLSLDLGLYQTLEPCDPIVCRDLSAFSPYTLRSFILGYPTFWDNPSDMKFPGSPQPLVANFRCPSGRVPRIVAIEQLPVRPTSGKNESQKWSPTKPILSTWLQCPSFSQWLARRLQVFQMPQLFQRFECPCF